MQLYEYECLECHRRTEKRQKFSDPEITTCPHCGGPIERVISAPAFSLKGGGWYADGYGSAKKSTGDSSSSTESAAPAAGATETKAAPAAVAPSAPAAPSTPAKS